MQENFRQFLDRLRQNGELVDLHQPVDIRHIATLVDQAKTALYFHNVIGYDMPVVSGIIRTRERAVMALGCENFGEIEHKLAQAIAKPIPPKHVKTSPTREVTLVGDDVDLYKLPIPMSSIYDGGPMITAGVVIARDPELGINSGIYRFIVKEKSLTGIDIVTPNNMRLFAQRALERNEPLPISISIGTHPIEITGSGYRAPLGVDEMAIAGGIRGEPVELAPCQTIDMPYIADAEIVLEAEILPTGWTWPEGRFGEFTRLMGGLHWNPLVRIKAISMRKDAIYYNLHMPWENTWLAAPTRYAAIRAGAAHRRRAGQGHQRHARRLRVLARGDLDQEAAGRGQERAARRALGDGSQARRRGRRRHRRQRSGRSRMGDRHPRAGRPRRDDRVERARQSRSIRACRRATAWCRPAPRSASTPPSRKASRANITSASPTPMPTAPRSTTTSTARRTRPGEAGDEAAVAALAAKILRRDRQGSRSTTPTSPRNSRSYDFHTIARAIGHLHATEKLWQDPRGRMCVRGSQFAAKPPGK